MALVDLLLGESELSDEEVAKLDKLLDEFSFPCVFFAPRPGQKPLSAEEMGQLFHDFNFRVTPVSAKDAIALDKSDPYIRATYYLHEHSRAIAERGMELKAASLGTKSTAIVVQPVLLRFIRAAIEGERYVEAGRTRQITNPNLTNENRESVLGSLAQFLDWFAEAMGDRFDDHESLHLSSPGWQAIGVLYHDVTFRLKEVDLRKFAFALASIDWSRSGELWEDLITERQNADGSISLVLNTAGASARREMVRILRNHFGLTERLKEQDIQDLA